MGEADKPFVSVCVPIYGVEKYIERCARSLLEQTYDNIELIFVDDCTNDRSIEILERIIREYPERTPFTKILKHEKNRGLAAARNTGLDAATGKYLIHVDSDDWVAPQMVDRIVRLAEECQAEIVIYGVIHEYARKSRSDLSSVCAVKEKNKTDFLKDVITQRISNSVWGKMYLTKLYRDNNIRALEGVNYAEDYAVYPLLIFHATKIVGIMESFYHYNRANEDSYTHVFKPIQLSNQMAAFRNIAGVFQRDNLFDDELNIALLQIYAWARRKAIMAHVTKDEVIKETGLLRFKYRQWRVLSTNHKIIVALDSLGLSFLTKVFVVFSDLVYSALESSNK